MRSFLSSLVIVLACCTSAAAQADLIIGGIVATQYNTIQEAIDAAPVGIAGTVVSVYPGTYSESINFLGKPITVQAQNPANRPIVNGNPTATGQQVIVSFTSGEGRDSVLDGIFVTSQNWVTDPSILIGILCNDSDPIIRNCEVFVQIQSAAPTVVNPIVTGILSVMNSAPLIEDCLVRDTYAFSSQPADGIRAEGGTIEILRSDLTNNGSALAANGGGEAINLINVAAAFISECQIFFNGVITGGGIRIAENAPTNAVVDVRGCLLYQNGPENIECIYTGGVGGSMTVVNIVNTAILNSFSFSGVPTWGLTVSGMLANASGCTIAGNNQNNFIGGGSINLSNGAFLDMDSSIVWANLPAAGPLGSSAGITVANTIFDNCDVQSTSQAVLDTYGASNINSNPQFLNPAILDYRLASFSPCVDAGQAGALCVDSNDVLRTVRTRYAIHDMGAAEWLADLGATTLSLAYSAVDGTLKIEASGTANAPFITLISIDPLNGTNPGAGPWGGLFLATADVNAQVALGLPFFGLLDGLGEYELKAALPYFVAGPGLVLYGVTHEYPSATTVLRSAIAQTNLF